MLAIDRTDNIVGIDGPGEKFGFSVDLLEKVFGSDLEINKKIVGDSA